MGGYQTFMAQKTRSDHFEGSTFDANVAFWGVPKNLDEYANASHDTFEMQKHIESYLDAPSDGTFLPKIAFLQIEKKTANLGRLANFLRRNGHGDGQPSLGTSARRRGWQSGHGTPCTCWWCWSGNRNGLRHRSWKPSLGASRRSHGSGGSRRLPS